MPAYQYAQPCRGHPPLELTRNRCALCGHDLTIELGEAVTAGTIPAPARRGERYLARAILATRDLQKMDAQVLGLELDTYYRIPLDQRIREREARLRENDEQLREAFGVVELG